MRRLMVNIGFIGFLAMSANAYAQATAATVKPQTIPQVVLSQESNEVTLLRMQLKDVKEFHESILETVYWALGGTFVLVGLLLGFGWLANFKVYERDKNAMKAELEAAIAAKFSKIESSIRAGLADIPDLVNDATRGSITECEKSIKSSIDRLSRQVFAIEVRHLKGKMESNPSDSMALTNALNLLEMCVRQEPDELPEIMHFMLKKIDKGGKLTANEITRLNELLDVLPSHYRTLTDKLRAKLIASDIF